MPSSSIGGRPLLALIGQAAVKRRPFSAVLAFGRCEWHASLVAGRGDHMDVSEPLATLAFLAQDDTHTLRMRVTRRGLGTRGQAPADVQARPPERTVGFMMFRALGPSSAFSVSNHSARFSCPFHVLSPLHVVARRLEVAFE